MGNHHGHHEGAGDEAKSEAKPAHATRAKPTEEEEFKLREQRMKKRHSVSCSANATENLRNACDRSLG